MPTSSMPVTVPRPLADAPPPAPSARRVRTAAALLVLASVGVRWWLVAGRDHYGDDFRMQHLADTSALLSPSYLFFDYDGHLMPGALLLAGLVERAAPLEWAAAAATLVGLQLLASLALLRLLRLLLGDRPLLLPPLVFGLFTPLTLGSTTWWAAGLNSLPLQIGVAVFLAEAVRLARTGSRRYAVRGSAALALTLCFYLKAVLVPWVGFAVVALVLLRDGERRPLAAAWHRARGVWTGSLAVTAVWAVVYLSTRDRAPVGTGDVGDVVITIRTGLGVLAAAVLGGPVGWSDVPPHTPLARSPLWLVVAGALVLLAACAWTCAHRRGAAAVWVLVVGQSVVGLAIAGAGRAGLGVGDVVPLAGRYYAIEAVLLPVAAALLATLPARTGGGAPPTGGRRAVAATTAATLAFGVVALASTLDHARAWQADRTGAYLAAARESLAAAGSAPLLDQPMPPDVMWQLGHPGNLISRTLAVLDDRPPIAAWTSELRVLDDDGHLRPATVQPGASLTGGPAPDCGWTIASGEGTAVPMTGSMIAWEWTARLDYVADRDGTVVVGLDGGEPVRAPVRAGSHALFVRLSGGGPALHVTARTPGLQLCVGGGTVGDVVIR